MSVGERKGQSLSITLQLGFWQHGARGCNVTMRVLCQGTWSDSAMKMVPVGQVRELGMGAGDLISVASSSAATGSSAAADFQGAVSGETFWGNRLLQIMQEGSHAQATLVCQIWTSLLSRKAFADNVKSPRVSGAVIEALDRHLQPPYDASKKVA